MKLGTVGMEERVGLELVLGGGLCRGSVKEVGYVFDLGDCMDGDAFY